MKYRKGLRGGRCFIYRPPPGCPARAPRSPPPPRPASPEVTASCTCAVLPPEAVFHVSSTAPPRARVPPSVAGALGTYSPRNGRRTRGAVPWRARRRRLVAVGFHPVLLRDSRRRFDGLAEPTAVSAMCCQSCPCPAPPRPSSALCSSLTGTVGAAVYLQRISTQ